MGEKSEQNPWIKIMSTTDRIYAEIIKGRLEENNIEVISLNKQDSMYVQFNSTVPIELYVLNNQVIQAMRILDSQVDEID